MVNKPQEEKSQITAIFGLIDELWEIFEDTKIKDMSSYELHIAQRIISMRELANKYKNERRIEYDNYRLQEESNFRSSQYDSPA